MKAFVYGANGAEITDVAKPPPKATQVLVGVRAYGLDRADLGMTKGHAHGSAGGVGAVSAWNGPARSLNSGPTPKASKSATGDGLRRGGIRGIHAGRSRPAVPHPLRT